MSRIPTLARTSTNGFTIRGGSVSEQLIATFPDVTPPPCCHLQFRGIAQYNFRTVTAGEGLGLSWRPTTRRAWRSSTARGTTLAAGRSGIAGLQQREPPILGISVGWGDLYQSRTSGPVDRRDGLASGPYWFEVTVDPYHRFKNRTTRTTRRRLW